MTEASHAAGATALRQWTYRWRDRSLRAQESFYYLRSLDEES